MTSFGVSYHRRLLPPDSGTWLLGLLTRLMVQCASVVMQDRVTAVSDSYVSHSGSSTSKIKIPTRSLGVKAARPHMNPKHCPQKTLQ